VAVRVELSRLLRKYVPDYDDEGVLVDYEEGMTARDVAKKLDIPSDKVFMVMVNRMPSKIGSALRDGDRVTLALILGAG